MENVNTRLRSELCESPAEELASSITHGIGVALSIAALVIMIMLSLGDAHRVVSASIFGSSLIALLSVQRTLLRFTS